MIIGVSAFHKRVHIKRSGSVDRDNICHVVAVRGSRQACAPRGYTVIDRLCQQPGR